MDPVTIGYIIAGVQLAIAAYGNYKSQQAAEDAAEAEAERRANLARLARLKFAHQQGIAVDQLAKLDKKSIRERDIEKNVILAKKIQQKKIEGTVSAKAGMSGRSSSFYMDRITGDLLRGQDAIKEDFLVKRLEVHSKKEAVMQGLQTDRINMQYGIAGLTAPSTPDRTLMWLQMGDSALDAVGTYYKYSRIQTV